MDKKAKKKERRVVRKEEVLVKLRGLWDSYEIKDDYWVKAQRLIVQKIKKNQFRYEEAERLVWKQYNLAIPWHIIACIHAMECSLNFEKGIHCGQSWKKKTTWVPKGRGPFSSWEAAAMDALSMKKHSYPDAWTVAKTLDFLEKYNGLGYRKYHPDVNSPYLWSGTNHYEEGKYVSDGKWDKDAVSKQLGTVLILKGLYYNGRSSQEE